MSRSAEAGAPSVARVGRREQRKAATRTALMSEAWRLFATQGYEATTLEQIAAAVPVSLRTLMRYFESKERLFHAWPLDVLAQFRAEFAARSDDFTVLAFWRAWEARYLVEGVGGTTYRDYRRLQVEVPVLHGMWLMILQEYIDILGDALAEEIKDANPADLRLAAVAMVNGPDVIARSLGDKSASEVISACLEAIDRVGVIFEPVGVRMTRPTKAT